MSSFKTNGKFRNTRILHVPQGDFSSRLLAENRAVKPVRGRARFCVK